MSYRNPECDECKHFWQMVHFEDEYPRERCIYCLMDRSDYEHDMNLPPWPAPTPPRED